MTNRTAVAVVLLAGALFAAGWLARDSVTIDTCPRFFPVVGGEWREVVQERP
ncbi:MAG TPA: hypothetical protein VKA83_25845 [Methylomirabilota bacterium]|nr:hypothetical protein [Methylomirabilota bacterium]